MLERCNVECDEGGEKNWDESDALHATHTRQMTEQDMFDSNSRKAIKMLGREPFSRRLIEN